MARRGENIYKRKDGRWEGRYIVARKQDGKPQFRSVYARNYRAVKELLIVKKGGNPEAINPASRIKQEIFADWAEHWLAYIARPTVRATTYENYRRIVSTHLIPCFGTRPLDLITEDDVKAGIAGWKARLASSTVQAIVRVFKSIMKQARIKGLCACRFEGIRTPGKPRKPRILTLSEQRKIELAASDQEGLMYLLCLYTGLRLGEVCALRRTDVDFEDGSISVRGALRRIRGDNSARSYLEVGAPKSDCSERDIPVPAFLLARLKAFEAQGAGVYVFAGAHGLPLDPRTVQGRFKRFLTPLGIKNAHMHTLRHTYATRCLEQGVGCDVLCELLGHSSPKVTLSFYAHCTLEQKRNCVGRLKMLA